MIKIFVKTIYGSLYDVIEIKFEKDRVLILREQDKLEEYNIKDLSIISD